MRILLASSQGYGAHFLLRLMREGHECEWFIIDEKEKKPLAPVLKGLIPPPLKETPDPEDFDLICFDSTGHGQLADDMGRSAPVIGDSLLASRLEDDRLFGIETMEACGIEVPPYTICKDPDDAREFLEENPKRYVYKPFEPKGAEWQNSDVTYVSDSAEDMLKCLDELFANALEQPFILQEVVAGVECSTNGWFDGENFHFITHCIETKKFMAGDYGPNTGCSGNLQINPRGAKRLVSTGLLKLIPFLRASGFRGPLDLNTICNEHHVYGLEFTSRFGYDSTPCEFAMLDGDLGQFLFDIATGPALDPVPPIPHDYAAAARYSIPPYPRECPGEHPGGLPIKGVELTDAWRDFYLYDAMLDGDELVTAGVTGFVGCPIARGHSAEAAWEGVKRRAECFKVPNMQVRDDLCEATLERLRKVQMMGWI